MRFAPLIPARGQVLDLACGSGRHASWLTGAGYQVLAVDRDPDALARIAGAETLRADLEGPEWPLAGRQFDGIVVTNYLYRPCFERLVEALKPGGVLIYETFAMDNESVGRPANPDVLLRRGELLERCRALRVVAYEDGFTERPGAAFVQRICAVREAASASTLSAGPVRYRL